MCDETLEGRARIVRIEKTQKRIEAKLDHIIKLIDPEGIADDRDN